MERRVEGGGRVGGLDGIGLGVATVGRRVRSGCRGVRRGTCSALRLLCRLPAGSTEIDFFSRQPPAWLGAGVGVGVGVGVAADTGAGVLRRKW